MSIKSFSIILFGFLLLGCDNEQPVAEQKVEQKDHRPLIVQGSNGKYTEWYPGHEQIKMTGRKNEEGQRVGVWKYFSEQGVELSITVYNNGKKEGHTIVKYPNGAIHYTGEYLNDEPIGEWKFYDENGELTQTKDYTK
ncbi:hypothetical protein CW751_11080 [Brumimicrobium salinarum]|uniref:Toxin-antitoxin system YwqK family antitoxin n=1 Tax=Brumimicrobium salinarum TaxID=2058658 RepID=A0A2I0R0T7_9FLAO|nr:hypothetical protein [Brumimicrobium salinarum]PKR80198.1 hypothetical protein CW751_11080 [Brumimicrobium salinarum]